MVEPVQIGRIEESLVRVEHEQKDRRHHIIYDETGDDRHPADIHARLALSRTSARSML
jgi:hypothetical protein